MTPVQEKTRKINQKKYKMAAESWLGGNESWSDFHTKLSIFLLQHWALIPSYPETSNKNFIKLQSKLYKRQSLSKCKTSCWSESSSFNLMKKWIKQLLCCYILFWCKFHPPHPTAFTALVQKSCAWVWWLLNKVLLGQPWVTQWPLGPLRSTHVHSEEKEVR